MTPPTIAQFKSRFDRDFTYGTSMETVRDVDIQRAMDDAKSNTNPGIFIDETEYQKAYLYLTAHYLIMNLNQAMMGQNGSFAWLTGSQSVGEVSETFVIPEWLRKDPFMSFVSTTRYGASYVSIVAPRLRGNVKSFHRDTLP